MFAIPLTNKISWHNPPVVTITLIIINIFVLFAIQNDDHYQSKIAREYYFDSGLDKIEIPLYLNFLENEYPEEFKKINTAKIDKDRAQRIALYRKLNFDSNFLNQLSNHQIAFPDPVQKAHHLGLRQQYEERQSKIIYLHYGFRPARPRPVTWLTSMFLHGGLGHLFGNMIFLWLIGCLIEYGCRRFMLLVIYGLGGLAAVGFFGLLNANSMVPMIGASGAISGIMGAFTVLYGFKRVRIFLSLGFYFNYLRFPAIVLLPLWISNELFQMFFNENSVVAYAAHLGGLMGGAAIAFVAGKIPNLLSFKDFEEAHEDPVQPLIEKALTHMGRLEFTKARELLVQADSLQPHDEKILNHLFTIDQQNPAAPQFHQTSQRILTLLCRQPATYPQAHKVYQLYIRLAQTVKLGASLYLQLCRAFCDIEKVDDAHRLASVLVKKRPDMEGIAALLLKLAHLHAKIGNQKAHRACLKCVCKQFPMSSEARIAKRQMNLDLKP